MTIGTLCFTGASGLLGRHALPVLANQWQVVGLVHEQTLQENAGTRIVPTDLLWVDIPTLLGPVFEKESGRKVIIHAAALTNVDACEGEKRSEVERLHVDVAAALAQYAADHDIHLIYISTDHLFDGVTGNYTEQDTPRPVNWYAETKYRGEQAVQEYAKRWTVIRTNFFGPRVGGKPDLAEWIVASLQQEQSISLYTDVIFSPLYVPFLVEILSKIVADGIQGILHVAAHDACSKYEFGVRLAHAFGLSTNSITPVSIDEKPSRVQRPKNMSLNVSKTEALLGGKFPTIEESIAAYRAATM